MSRYTRSRARKRFSVTTPLSLPLVESVAHLRSFTAIKHELVWVRGFSSAGDGGEGIFRWTVVEAEDDGGRRLNSVGLGVSGAGYQRVHDGPFNVRWYGAKGDGVTDDSAAFASALAALDNAGGGTLFIPAGRYALGTYLLCPSNVNIIGAGIGATVLLDITTSTPSPSEPLGMLTWVSKSNVEVAHMTLTREIADPVGVPPATPGFEAIRLRAPAINAKCVNFHIHDVETINILGENFYCDGYSEHVHFTHCRAIRPGSATSNDFNGNAFNANCGNDMARGIIIADNYIEGGAHSVSAVQAYGDGVIVSRNHVARWGPGAGSIILNIGQSHGFVCCDNVIENADLNGPAVAPLICIGFPLSGNENTSGIVRGNVMRNCTIYPSSNTSSCIRIHRVNGPVLVEGNSIDNCHPGGVQSLATHVPAGILISADNDAAIKMNIVVGPNKFDFGTGNEIHGVRVENTVHATNRVRIRPQEFADDWLPGTWMVQYKLDTAPESAGLLADQFAALGGGAAPTLGTIGGSGPAAAAQNKWMKIVDGTGAVFWVPVWA